VQISDTHIGFNKDANPDVSGTLTQAIDLVNAMPEPPSLIIHTGDITHLSRPAEFDLAAQLFARLRVTEMHTVPGEHDTSDAAVAEYFARFGAASKNKGYYSFDHSGVHFLALVNVLEFKAGGLGSLGAEQLAWAKRDLAARSASTPIVVFAHMPLFNVYEPWGWGTQDAGELMDALRRFGSVTVLNGHIHQIVQKVEGHISFHTARSTAYPQPLAGVGEGPGPLKVSYAELPRMLGITSVTVKSHPRTLALVDRTLAAPVAGATAGAGAKIVKIDARNFMFSPQNLTVSQGATVTWTNFDQEPHTVVSDSGLFRSGAIDTQESFSFKFDKPGTYRYLCTIHPRMLGTVVVL
jgi:plastocyanin